MTKQLTQAQIKQLRVFLADYGLGVTAKVNKTKGPRIPWPLGPKKLGAPRFKSRCYGSIVGSSTAARISASEYAEIKKRSSDMFSK
jgi:hypothetical protein